MDIVSKNNEKICWINKNAFPVGTSWKTMHKHGEQEHPGFITKIHTPGEFHDGEMTPRSYEGKCFPVEADYVLISVSTEELDEFSAMWEEAHPYPTGLAVIAWEEDKNGAQYSYFRSQFKRQHPELEHCAMRLSYETVSCLEDKVA